ncbi:MAG: hypothetical protein DMG50_22270 [Acidobacteria bacterium]|nr:MAG: hypothetical protein DMG50_22270 [Acidobacteriota bacterium]
MPEEKVLPKMKPMVLAEHHPTVVAIDPHFFPFLSTFSRLVPVETAGGAATSVPVPPRGSAPERGTPVLAGTVFSTLDVF